jgi:exo-rhamnogalacturonan lyase-like protein
MQIRHAWFSTMCAAVVLAASTAGALEVKLTVADGADTARKAGVITSGVPFAKGVVKDVGKLSVSAAGGSTGLTAGKVIPAQFKQIARWDDGSARWVLVDCQADVAAGKKTELVLRDDGKNVAPAKAVSVSQSGGAVTVSTGPLQFVVDKKSFNLFKSIKVDGKELVTGSGRGLVLYTADKKQVVASAPDQVIVEHGGPLRAVVCLKGKYPGVHNGLMGYTVRITAYAGSKALKLRAWLENDGAHGYAPRDKPYKPEWFFFDGMAVELGLGLGGAITAECEGVKNTDKFKVLQVIEQCISVYDPVAWALDDLRYMIADTGRSPAQLPVPRSPDPRARRGKKPAKPKKPEWLLKGGNRTDGVVTLSGANGKLTAAIRHFWQQYDKGIELDGATLKLWLWPLEGEWPRKWVGHTSPGYANRMVHPLRKAGLYNLPGSVHKGYEMTLDFSGRNAKETSAELSSPLFAAAPAVYYASTEAAPGLFAAPDVRTEDDECNTKLDAWMRMTRSVADPKSKSSIWHARTDRKQACRRWDFGFWHGWMEFGDLAVPGSAYVSLHYDWPWVVMTNLMRTGDLNYLRLGTEMMRHRVDVDQQWSDREQPQYRGFQRAGTGYTHFHTSRFTYSGPSVGTTWLPGVVLYYMLTGDAKSREAIDRTAAAMPAAWQRIFTSKDYYARRIPGQMQIVSRTIFTYCSMHALTGEKKWLDLAEKMFNSAVVNKWKSVGPHLHSRKQVQSQDYTRDDIKYCYSIQALCWLHHLTGNKKLFELLKAGCDTEFPENFFDAPLFLADLNAYVALKTGNKDYLDEAIEHWISAFPESKSPPVYLPANSQWSRRKAMFMRTGHLLQYAHWKWKKATGEE